MTLGEKVAETLEGVAVEAKAMTRRDLHLTRLLDQRRRSCERFRRPDDLGQAERDLEAAQIRYRRWSARHSKMLARMSAAVSELRAEVFKVTRGPA